MSIRKRLLPSGAVRWQIDYKDSNSKRRSKQFQFEREAKDYQITVQSELRLGVHIPDSASATIEQAAEYWLTRCGNRKLEAGTLRNYQHHVSAHILPMIGKMKLSRLTRPTVEAFKDKLLKTKSWYTVERVLISLGALIDEAMRRGLIGQNVAKGVKVDRPGSRHDKELRMPTKDELRRIIAGTAEAWPANKPWRAITILAIFTGMRSSEIRGLTWDNVDFGRKIVRIRQRADFQNTMGSPKTKAGRRDIPMSDHVSNALKQWKLAGPKSDLGLVFANADISHIRGNIIRGRFTALLRTLEIPHYRFNDLRHSAAALMIEQGMSPKKIQQIMGHSSIQMTYDLYGYLFEAREDDAAAFAQIEARLLH